MLNLDQFKIIDISIPISSKTACFPGDVPFSRNVTMRMEEGKTVNLSALTMSPHVGTHTESAVHITGSMDQENDMSGDLPLNPYIGSCKVIDIAPYSGEIQLKQVQAQLETEKTFPARVLIKTQTVIHFNTFEEKYAYFAPELVDYLSEKKVTLLGIDTPSVDHTNSKTLDTHHTLHRHKMCWLENLNLTAVSEGNYILIALPLKFMELEASPVRAILLEGR